MLKKMIIIFSSLNAGFHKNVLGNPYFERSCSLLRVNVKKSMTEFELPHCFRSKMFL